MVPGPAVEAVRPDVSDSPVSLSPVPHKAHALASQVAVLERNAIALALQATRGNKVAAARDLGISRATLYNRIKKSKI